MAVDGSEICARVTPEAAQAPGERMRFMAEMRHMHLIDPTTEEVIEVPEAMRANGAAAWDRPSNLARSPDGPSLRLT